MATVLCFGEVLLRLSAPGHELLLQQPRMAVHVGGAEANVAAALAGFGHHARLAGCLPANALGRAAAGELRKLGIDTGALAMGVGRMGLYFYTAGAGQRPGEVLYDRAGSAFALAEPAAYDWPALLAGVDLLHLSGITPALGADPARAALEAARAARAAGAMVSFDGNFRPTLWAASGREPAPLLHDLFAEADIAFADHRDVGLVLGRAFEHEDPDARFAAAAEAAFAAFPSLARIATTVRVRDRVDHHHLGARMACRDGRLHACAPIELGGIVDRIGAGDAFAAGVLHGLLAGRDEAASLAFGQATAALKHYLPGDAFSLPAGDVDALLAGGGLDVRR